MRTLPRLALTAMLILGGASTLLAQDTTQVKRDTAAVTQPAMPTTQPAPATAAATTTRPPGLPPISFDAAYTTARTQVPANATFDGAELETKDGVWVYEFDFKVPGVSGKKEVQVDAQTGALRKEKHEM